MAKVVGDIAVTVGADTSAFEKGMQRAGRSTQNFSTNAHKMAATMAKVGVAAAAAGVAIGVDLVRDATNAAKEIQNLSRIAGTSTTEFQKYAYAARSVGIEQDKLSDILKDVNDKFGDFLANGAGPLADFFDNIAPKVGVTAQQFARLSGPEALQLYVRSLEQAGVSQKEMTFYMEALASDATALVPLLADGGKALQDLGTAAEQAGVVIDSALISRGSELAEKWRQYMESMAGYTKQFALKAATMLDNAFGITESGKMEQLRTQIDGIVQERDELFGKLQFEQETNDRSAVPTDNNVILLQESIKATDEQLSILNDQALKLNQAATEREAALNRILGTSTGVGDGTKPGGGKKGRGGGGSKDNGLDAFRAQLATQSEALETWRAEQMEKLIAYRDAKVITETEYNDLEARIAKEHAERLAQIQATAMEGRLGHMRNVLGGFAALMQTENDKLFKIGKAAALAQAIVDGHQSAVAAWKHGMAAGGPPLAAAYTAASLARTGALISSIASASSRGTSTGGATGGGAVPSGGAQTVNRTIDVRLIGGDSVTQTNMRSLVNELGEYLRDGGSISGLRLA